MSESIRKLWTQHAPGFSLTSGKVDHSRSEYYTEVTGVKAAYHRLWEKIGVIDGQIVWCFTVEQFPKTSSKITWQLEVPETKIICCVDDSAWNRYLGKSDFYNPKQFPNESKRLPLNGDWWEEVIVKGSEQDYFRSALIPHPLEEGWIKGCTTFGKQPLA